MALQSCLLNEKCGNETAPVLTEAVFLFVFHSFVVYNKTVESMR